MNIEAPVREENIDIDMIDNENNIEVKEKNVYDYNSKNDSDINKKRVNEPRPSSPKRFKKKGNDSKRKAKPLSTMKQPFAKFVIKKQNKEESHKLVQTVPKISTLHAQSQNLPFSRINENERNAKRHTKKNALRMAVASRSKAEKHLKKKQSMSYYTNLNRYIGKYCSYEQRNDRHFDVMDFISSRLGARVKGHITRREIQRKMFAAYYIQLWWREMLPKRQAFLAHIRKKNTDQLQLIQSIIRYDQAYKKTKQQIDYIILIQSILKAKYAQMAHVQNYKQIRLCQRSAKGKVANCETFNKIVSIKIVQEEIRGFLYLNSFHKLTQIHQNTSSNSKTSCCHIQ